MQNNIDTYSLKNSAKAAIGFLFVIVGIPMFYTSILSFQAEEPFWGTVLLILLMLWGIVVFRAISFKILLDDTHIEKVGLISSSSIHFNEVDKVHFGSTFSNFYLQSKDKTIYISNDFKDYENLINQVVNKIEKRSHTQGITFDGDSDKLQKYGLD